MTAAVVSLLVASIGIAQTQRDKSLEEERLAQVALLREIREKTFSDLSGKEAEIYKSIQFRIEGGDDIQNCFAGRDDSGRIVVIGQAFARCLYFFTQANVYGELYGAQDRAQQHINHVIKTWHQNLERQRRNQPPVFIPGPAQHFNWPAGVRERVNSQAEQIWPNALAFAVAHEVGHHMLGEAGDFRHRPPGEQRDIEQRADEWAIQALLASGQPPVAGAMVIAYFEALYEELGKDATHPSNECRARALVTSTLESAERFRTRLVERGKSVEEMRAALRRRLQLFDEAGICVNPSQVSTPSTAPHQDRTVTLVFRSWRSGGGGAATFELAIDEGESLYFSNRRGDGEEEVTGLSTGGHRFDITDVVLYMPNGRSVIPYVDSCSGRFRVSEGQAAYTVRLVAYPGGGLTCSIE